VDVKISLNDMLFYGFHGSMEVERELGQKFLVDVSLTLDLEEAITEDDPSKSISSYSIYQITNNIVTERKFSLIETLAYNIAKTFLKKFPEVSHVFVRIKRPNLYLSGIVGGAEVEIELDRSSLED